MSLWTSIRDLGESAAVLAGNYLLPGSAAITSHLTSQGSQEQLRSPLGQMAQLGSGGYGGYEGNLSNYGSIFGGGGGTAAGMGGAQGLSFDGAGAGLSGAGMEGTGAGLTAGGYGGGYDLFGAGASTGAGLGGAGMEGAGAGLTGGFGAGAESGGGSFMDMMRRRMGGYGGGGFGGGGGMPGIMRQGLGALQLAGGLQQYQAQSQRQAQQQAYAQQLQQLMANPSSVESLPGYNAGLRAVQRKGRAEGFGGSGSMAAALAGYGGQQYQQQLSNLASLQGGSQPVGSPMMGLVGAGTGAYNLFGGGGGGAGAAPNLYSLFG